MFWFECIYQSTRALLTAYLFITLPFGLWLLIVIVNFWDADWRSYLV